MGLRIPINELKNGLSRYIARARAGEVIEITSHDRPVARLVGIPELTEHAALRPLFAEGGAAWRGGKPSLEPPLRLASTGRAIAEIVLDERN